MVIEIINQFIYIFGILCLYVAICGGVAFLFARDCDSEDFMLVVIMVQFFIFMGIVMSYVL